jgi:DNA repair protein RecO (recombination protein O)
MSTEKSLAIVLRLVEFSETSVITTLFTEDFGKIGAIAKGARRPKSPFEAALDLLAVCRIVFIHKSTDTLDLLTEAKLERRFRSAARDLSRLYAGFYVAELLQELTDPGDAHPALFQAANQTLFDLDQDQPVPALVLRFELVLLRELGLLPSLDTCVGCGAPIELAGRVAFGLLAGGVLCNACRIGQQQVISVSAGAMKSLQRFAALDGELWRRVEMDRRTSGELRGMLNRYFAHVLGHRPKMHNYLGTLLP